jgi:aldehyde:ferredoxin oxidoreductase
MGPVTEMEYLSRKDRYDGQLVDIQKFSKDKVVAMKTGEKMQLTYDYRQNQYEKLKDAVYCRRGWTQNGIPTPQKMKSLGFTEDAMLKILQDRIDADEKAGLNVWGGKYIGDEKPPNAERKYWEKW